MSALLWPLWALSCQGEPKTEPARPPPVVPAPVLRAPEVALRLPEQQGKSPAPVQLTPQRAALRELLQTVVMDHARDPTNPWAIAHGMLALGPEMRLTNGADPVDWIFEHYGEVALVGETPLLTFPHKRGDSLVEPHTDLLLKALTESNTSPDRAVTVRGRAFVVRDLYRHSLWRAWVDGPKTAFQEAGYNDTPWALQGLSSWAPLDLAWSAPGGHEMTMSGFTHQVVEQLAFETREMRAAAAEGKILQKDTRKGLFRYTCGGQHLLQGAAYAVARGFGSEQDRATICEQLALLRWRIDVEFAAIDAFLTSPEATAPLRIVLLSQRLKFLGHWLETTHKIGALGVCPLGPDDVAATERVMDELARTVDALSALGVWADVGAVKSRADLAKLRSGGGEQVYLDLVGDASHAVRGIDLATGKGAIRY